MFPVSFVTQQEVQAPSTVLIVTDRLKQITFMMTYRGIAITQFRVINVIRTGRGMMISAMKIQFYEI